MTNIQHPLSLVVEFAIKMIQKPSSRICRKESAQDSTLLVAGVHCWMYLI